MKKLVYLYLYLYLYYYANCNNNFSMFNICVYIYIYTDLPKYYARLQTAVARGLGLPAGRLAGRHTDATPKHSFYYFISVSE